MTGPAADIRQVLGLQLLFDACLTNDEDFALVGGKAEDPRNVDGRTVRRREDFFLFLFFFYQHACCLVTYISVVTLGYHTVELGIPNVSSFFL